MTDRNWWDEVFTFGDDEPEQAAWFEDQPLAGRAAPSAPPRQQMPVTPEPGAAPGEDTYQPDVPFDPRALPGAPARSGLAGAMGAPLPPVEPRPDPVPLSDLGKRVARGATEIGASIPEGIAIAGAAAGAGNPNAAALFAQEEVLKAQEQISLAEARLSSNPDMGQEDRARIASVIAEERSKIEAYQPLVDIADGPLKQDPAVSSRPLFQTGDALRQASLDLFGTPDPQFDDRFIAKLAEGAGSMAGFVGATLLTGPLGAAAAGSATNASGMYSRALEDGATEEQARAAAYIGSFVGLSEAVPIAGALRVLPSPLRDKAAGALGRRLSNALVSAGEEGLQEALVGIANNLTEKGIWNPDQGWSENVAEDALIGAILGGGLGVIAPTGDRGAPPPAPGPTTGRGPRDEPPQETAASAPLTAEDRASYVPDDVIGEGRAILDDITRGNAAISPAQPSSGVAPLETQRATGTPRTEPSRLGTGLPVAPMPPAPPAMSGLAPEQAVTRPPAAPDIPEGAVPADVLYDDGPAPVAPPARPERSGLQPTPEAAPAPPSPAQGGARPEAEITDAERMSPDGRYYYARDEDGVPGRVDLQGQAWEAIPEADYQSAVSGGATPAPTATPTPQEANVQPTEGVQPETQEPAPVARTADLGSDAGSAEIVPTLEGREDVAIAPSGKSVNVKYAVVEASQLTTSHDSGYALNPSYPQELQPRDRTRVGSQERLRKIFNEFDPRVLGANPLATDGAPIISKDGVVESGNGRTLVLEKVYDEGAERAKAYRQFLQGQGYNVDGMDRPVLVRIRQDEMSMEERAAFARDANDRTTDAMSATERSMADAKAMPDSLIGLYRGGDIDAVGNRDFVRGFIRSVVSDADQAQMIDASGEMSQDAVRRIQGALLARAYGDANLVAALMEASDGHIKAIGGALMDVAAAWAQMRQEAKNGTIAASMDQTPALLEAVRIVDRARRDRRNVAEFVGQGDLLSGDSISPMGKDFLALMFRNVQSWTQPTARDRLVKGLRFHIDQARETQAGPDMFGDEADPRAIAQRARVEQYKDDDNGRQGDLLARPRQDTRGSDGPGIRDAGGGRAESGIPEGSEAEGAASARQGGESQQADVDARSPEEDPARDTGGTGTPAAPEAASGTGGTDSVAPATQAAQVKTLDRVLTPDNRDGIGFYVSGSIDVQLDALPDGDVRIEITTNKSRYRGRAKETSSRTQRLLYSQIKGDLKPTARGEIEALLSAENVDTQAAGQEVSAAEADLRASLAKAKTVAAKQRAADAWVLKQGKAENVEFLVLLDDAGNLMSVSGGSISHVEAPREMYGEARAGRIAYVTHNHPASRGLSVNDILMVSYGYSPLAAVGHNGKSRHVAASGFLTDVDHADSGAVSATRDALNIVSDMVRSTMQQRITTGQMDVDTADATHAILFSRLLDRIGAIKYTGDGPSVLETWGVDENAILDGKEDAARERFRRAGFPVAEGRRAEGDQGAGSGGQPDMAAGAGTQASAQDPAGDNGSGRVQGPVADQPRTTTSVVDQEAAQGEPEERRSRVSSAGINQDRIDDFGQRLEGARKFAAQDWAQSARDVLDQDIAMESMARIWPEPDYAKMLEEGVDPAAVAFIHAARDEIPNKPRNDWKLRNWASNVRDLRQMARDLADGTLQMEQIRNAPQKRSIATVLGRADLYEAVGHDKPLKGVRLKSSAYSLRDGVNYSPSKVFWTVERDRAKSAWSNWPQEFVVAETKAEAIAAFKAKIGGLDLGPQPKAGKAGGVRFEIRGWRKSGKWFIGKKLGKDWAELKTFDTSKEAREYMQRPGAQEELEALLSRFKETPSERGTENAPRVGADVRNNQDVTPEMFQEAFGFRGVQFGNYVEGPRRQADLNRAYDALMDLAGVIGVPPQALSLNGSLGLAFGARGKGGKNAGSAHYEPDMIVINLTKGSGAGSLAHEWFHGVDNYFSRARGEPINYMTDKAFVRGEGVRPEVVEAFSGVMKAINATNLKLRSSELDKRRTKPYWATNIEMAARSFESYIIGKLQDQGAANDYLANILSDEAWKAVDGDRPADSYPYIKASEMPGIREAFDTLFDIIETKETDTGVAMFARNNRQSFRDVGLDPRFTETMAGGRVVAETTPEFREKARLVAGDMRSELRKFGLPNIEVRAAERMFGEMSGGEVVSLDGFQFQDLIMVALDGWGRTPQAVVRHEVIHALRNSNLWGRDTGLFRPAEWRALEARVLGDADLMARVEADYPNETREKQIEEGVAALFQNWTDGNVEASGFVAAGLRAIRSALEAIGNALRGNGFNTADSVFRRVESGEVGRRQNAGRREPPMTSETGPSFAVRMDDIFYSPLLRAIEGAKQKQAPAQDWKAIIAKMPGVKKVEVDWLGVEDWLDSQEGTQVPREALEAFVRYSQVELEEQVGQPGGDQPNIVIEEPMAVEPESDYLETLAEDYMDEAAAEVNQEWAEYYGVESLDDMDPENISADDNRRIDMETKARARDIALQNYAENPEFQVRVYDDNGTFDRTIGYDSNDGTYNVDGEYMDRSGVYSWADDEAQADGPKDGAADFESRHESYTEDGGTNYREVLLRVPNLHDSGRNLLRESGQSAKVPFVQSSHFDVENIVVHARAKDRKGADGESVLFIEEIQSDLASKWREATESPEVTARRRELQERLDAIAQELKLIEGRISARMQDYYAENNIRDAARTSNIIRYRVEGRAQGARHPDDDMERATDAFRETDIETYAQVVDLERERNALRNEQVSLGSERRMNPTTPDTPFKEEHTYTLMVKRMLREAAEKGYDKLSWTPGYMQAERWNAAAQSVVEGIQWGENAVALQGDLPATGRLVSLDMGDSDTMAFVVDDAGKIVEDRYRAAPVVGEDLSRLIGPGLASQIMAEPSGTANPGKITFPSSGYAIAYDQQIRKAVEKFAKRYGGRVYEDRTLPDMTERGGDARPVWSIDITPELREAALGPMPMFAVRRKSPDQHDKKASALAKGEVSHGVTLSTPVEVRKEKFIRAVMTQPLDYVFRIPFAVMGGLDKHGRWRWGNKGWHVAAHIATEKKFSKDGSFAFLNPMMERVRRGIVDRYGLDPEYVERERRRTLEEGVLASKGVEHIEALKAQNIGAQEARVLQAVLTGEAVADSDMASIAEPIRKAIDDMGREAVELGLLDAEAYERNRGAYLHRVYAKQEGAESTLDRWVSAFARGRRKKIVGNQFKGRGLFEDVPVATLMRQDEAFRQALKGAPVKGDKFKVLVRLTSQTGSLGDISPAEKPRVTDKVYWPADKPVPERFKAYESRGTWEVRGERGGKITIWRDFTKAERLKMGEILDARYTIAKTYSVMAGDLANGRFFRDIAQNEQWARKTPPPEGTVDENPNEGRFVDRIWANPDIQWVKVPDTKIAKSNTRRYGALSGMYVRAEIWQDLQEIDALQTPTTWRRLLTQWKLNKTARSPVVHMNNVMSNFVLMDMADVRSTDLMAGARDMATGSDLYKEAQMAGAFGADMVTQEIRDNVLRPLLRELADEMRDGKGGWEAEIGRIGKIVDGLVRRGVGLDRWMVNAYQFEDQVFRMAVYRRRRQQGASVEAAAIEARDQFINYDIRAPWVNAARQSVLPFLSYTYRAAPMVARTLAERPWKVAKYYAIAQALQMMAYAVAPSEWDEEEERGSMRKDQQGKTWIGTDRLLRMPWLGGREGDLPVYMDARRWIPAGDIFDTSAGDIPAWLQVGGPLVLGFEIAFNKNMFFDEPIYNPNTTTYWDRMEARADHVYKAWMPSAAYIPGSWYWDKWRRAAREDAVNWKDEPYLLSEALLSSVGIKIAPQDVDAGYEVWDKFVFGRAERDLGMERTRLKTQLGRNIISKETHDKALAEIERKLARIEQAREAVFSARD